MSHSRIKQPHTPRPRRITLCGVCGHTGDQHGKESAMVETPSNREVCLECDGYEEPGYPNGKAWHRFTSASSQTQNPTGDTP